MNDLSMTFSDADLYDWPTAEREEIAKAYNKRRSEIGRTAS